MSILRRATFVLLAALLVAPLAGATSVYRTGANTAQGCEDTCTLRIANTVDATDVLDCTGSAGAYTACRVEHWCNADATGILATVTIYCHSTISGGDLGTCSMLASLSCFAYGAETVIVPRGQCVRFYAEGTLGSPTGTLAVNGPVHRVCVNGNGPY